MSDQSKPPSSPFDTPADTGQCKPVLNTGLTLPYLVVYGVIAYIFVSIFVTSIIYRFYSLVSRGRARKRSKQKGVLLIVLGSGGHTSEMFALLRGLGTPFVETRFARRVYVVGRGDGFSAEKARAFEAGLKGGAYDVVTVRRAREIHQSIYTTPVSALGCLWECMAVLRGRHVDFGAGGAAAAWPQLILTNGPGTGVCVVVASVLLRFFGVSESQGEMRTVYVESWARVKTLSLSGKILRYIVDRFCVQWRMLAQQFRGNPSDDLGKRVEFVGGVAVVEGRE